MSPASSSRKRSASASGGGRGLVVLGVEVVQKASDGRDVARSGAAHCEFRRGAHAAHRSARRDQRRAAAMAAGQRGRALGLDAGRGGARLGPRHDQPVAARQQVAHVGARLGGGAGDAQLVGGVAQALVHELASVAGKRGIHHERRVGAGRHRRRRSAEHAARGDRGGADESDDLCSDSSHTYEHGTYD